MEGAARQLVREGVVSEVYPERHSCRVTFADKSALVSAELPVLIPFALENKAYMMPDVGDEVICLFSTNADQTGTGWIIGARYHDKAQPTVADINKTRLDFKDGTYLEYDRAKHELRVEVKGNVVINAERIDLN